MATTTDLEPAQAWTGAYSFAESASAQRAKSFAIARRHTRVVRALRWSLPGAAATVVVLYFTIVLHTIGWVDGLSQLEIPSIIPTNLTMDNPRYEGFNKDGGSYVVTAKTAVQDLVDTSHVTLNGINGDLTDANKMKTNLKAAHGLYNSKTNELELYDGIDIVAENGLRAKLTRATILTKENVIVSKEPVVVDMPSGTVRSNEMRLHNKSREIAFIDDVKAHLTPQKPDTPANATAPKPASKSAAPMISADNGPIDITSRRLDIDDTGKTATFTGNVHAVQGGSAMETAALEVHYATAEAAPGAAAAAPGTGGKIRRILSNSPVVMTRAPQDRVTSASFDYDAVEEVAVLTGDVVMTSGADRRATSDAATVDQRADTVLLSGNVVAVQGRNQLKGERLFVERAAGRTQLSSPAAEGEEPGRIATRFYRGEENAAQAAKQKAKQLVTAAAGDTNAAAVFKTDPTAPIDVDADRLDVDDHAKLAVFRGDVRAVQGDFVVRTSEMRAHYTGAAGLAEQVNPAEKRAPAQITKIEARGKVIVTSKNGQNAIGDWADFNVKDNQVVLGGDVILTQEKNVVRGSRLIIDMITGQSVIQNDPGAAWSATAAPTGEEGPGFTIRPSTGSRPSAIFYPRKKKDESKPRQPGAADRPDEQPSGGEWAPAGSSP